MTTAQIEKLAHLYASTKDNFTSCHDAKDVIGFLLHNHLIVEKSEIEREMNLAAAGMRYSSSHSDITLEQYSKGRYDVLNDILHKTPTYNDKRTDRTNIGMVRRFQSA